MWVMKAHVSQNLIDMVSLTNSHGFLKIIKKKMVNLSGANILDF